MKNTMKACLFGGAVFAAGIAHAGDTYRIAVPTSYAAPTYAHFFFDASTADFEAALRNPRNFSHFNSSFDASIQFWGWVYLDTNELQNTDCIMSPWISDADMAPDEIGYAAYHFANGGDLILFNDTNNSDAIADYLGVPTQNYASNYNLNLSGFLANGPFGDATGATASGYIGFLSPIDVANTNGQVLAINNAGEILAAFWDDNAFAPGSGRMIIVTDVNTVTGFIGAWDYTNPANPNTRFALNLLAGMIGNEPCNGADINADGILNFDDIDAFVEGFLDGCS